MTSAARIFVVVLAVSALATTSACAEDDFGEHLVAQGGEVGADAIATCPIPDANAIPGHESVFYLCAETVADGGQGCGPDGYLLGYGTKYSQRFYKNARPRMSARGQAWIDDVLVCLQHDLRAAIDASTSCDDIWNIAFDSHPQCYLDAGFCTLSPFDIAQVVFTIDAKDWLSRDAARQVVHTAAGCGKQYSLWMRLLFPALV